MRIGKKFIIVSPILILISILFCANFAQAAQKDVIGYVRDCEGNPIEDAQVTVNIKNGQHVLSTETDATDATGYYSLFF